MGGGGEGRFKPPPSRTLYPSSRLCICCICFFAFFCMCKVLHNVASFFPFSPVSHHLGNPASRPLFSISHTPPAPFSPGLPSPVPLHKMLQSKLKSTINCCYQKLHSFLYQQTLNLFYHQFLSQGWPSVIWFFSIDL